METNSTKEDKVRVGPDKKSSKRDKGFKENFLEPNVMRTPQNRKSRLPLTVEDLESRINLYAKCGDFSSLPEFSLKVEELFSFLFFFILSMVLVLFKTALFDILKILYQSFKTIAEFKYSD